MQHRLSERLATIHAVLQTQHPRVARVALATYDRDTDRVKTFVHSTVGDSPLAFYDVPLTEAPELRSLADARVDRVCDDLPAPRSDQREHTRKVAEAGYRSSYTAPVFHQDRLHGFLFFDASVPRYFDAQRVVALDVFKDLISMLLLNDMLPILTLKAAVRTALAFSRFRDEETGGHLDRMSRFARLIALRVAPLHGLDDEQVEFIYQFSALHDLGKMGIPDGILLKPGSLGPAEREVMKSHVRKGVEMIEDMLVHFGLEGMGHANILRNIVGCHHETLDGRGYPHALSGAEIPVEARITTVADVFDALTSARPYKPAWSNERALDYLYGLSGRQFDPSCVAALADDLPAVTAIQQRFPDLRA